MAQTFRGSHIRDDGTRAHGDAGRDRTGVLPRVQEHEEDDDRGDRHLDDFEHAFHGRGV